MTLFGRAYRVTVGTLRISAPLRVAFEIERTTRPTPNKASVRLYNLTRDHQAQVQDAADAQLVIEAGYDAERGPSSSSGGRSPARAATDRPRSAARRAGPTW